MLQLPIPNVAANTTDHLLCTIGAHTLAVLPVVFKHHHSIETSLLPEISSCMKSYGPLAAS